MNISPAIRQKALQLLAQQEQIQAIKLIKDATGCGLREAKDYVDSLKGNEPAMPLRPLTAVDIDGRLRELLAAGNKLQAIKLYKDTTGASLLDSKNYVEALETAPPAPAFHRSGQDSRDTALASIIAASEKSPKGGCFIATACYGDYAAPEVLVLRRFRDNRLSRSRAGRAAIRIYYVVSPPAARQLCRHPRLKHLVRAGLLAPLVRLLRSQ